MKTSKAIFLLAGLFTFFLLVGCSQHKPTQQAATAALSTEEAQAIAREAYIYGFPMVVNYKTLYNYSVDTKNPDYKGPFNQFSCEARLFTPDDTTVVTVNADTPYCMFWMDLRAEPMVLSVPQMEPERFYHVQLIDLYTHNYGYVGTLTTGNGAGKFLIAGPDWDGKKPDGIDGVIRSETALVFNIARTQLYNPDDMPRVKEIQTGYGLQPLSAFLGTDAPPAKPMPDFPKWVEGSQFDERFFAYLDFIMSLLEKPGDGEAPLWENLARLGIGPGNTFDFDALSPDIQEALQAGIKEGFDEMESFIARESADPLASAKIFGTRKFLQDSARENYGHENHNLVRATAAHMGLYGNDGDESIYPTYLVDADQRPFDASANRYTLTFEKGKLPPVQAFWSLTMYDGKTQLLIHNPLDRYLLNSTMLDQFKYEEDGSLILHLSKDSPGADRESNWLPAPNGPFYAILRLYGPKEEALNGQWTLPELTRVEDQASVPVTVDNFARAESDTAIRTAYGLVGGLNKWLHFRKPISIDEQNVIRMQRDTIYSGVIIDLSKAAVITLPDSGGRYMSLHVINQDHYSYVISKPGRHELTAEKVGSRYAYIIVRIFIDPDDPADVKKANRLQDKLKVEGGAIGELDLPNWNMEQLKVARDALNALASLGLNSARAFGSKEETDPIDHLVAAASGWGGMPQTEAFYVLTAVPDNSGTPHAVTVKDAPVDAFWSLTVYNADGFIEENPLGNYSFNNITAKPNEDGSITVHFGGCDDGRVNCLPISKGWTYAARMYRPRPEILDGTWKFPDLVPVK